MLVFLAVAATVLASPPPMVIASQLPKGAVFLALPAGEATVLPPALTSAAAGETRPGAFLGGWLDQFAVVRPHRSGPSAPPGLQLFVVVAPIKGLVGVHTVGTF